MNQSTFFCFRIEGMSEGKRKQLEEVVGQDIVLLDKDTMMYHLSRMMAANTKYNNDLSIRESLEGTDLESDIFERISKLKESIGGVEFGYSQVTKTLACDFPVAKQLIKVAEAMGLVKSESKGRFKLFNDKDMRIMYVESKIKSLEESIIANKQLLTLIENQ